MDIISALISIKISIQLYHWSTPYVNKHVISGKLYKKLDEHLDKFVESFNSYYDTVPIEGNIPLIEYDDKDFAILLLNFVKFLDQGKNNLTPTALITIIDEIIIDIQQALFLLRKK